MKTKFTNLFCLLCILANTLSAQEKETAPSKKFNGGFGHGSFTAQQINIGDLNRMLSANGYGNIQTTQMAWGGGGNFAIDNFMIGGEGASFTSSRASNNFNSVNLTGGYGYLNTGYILPVSKRSVFYPMLGAGLAGFSMNVNKKDVSTNFEDQINSPNTGAVINTGGFVLNGQLAYQYFFFGEEKQGFFLGLKAGYRYSPSSWKMDINGTQLNNAPNINMNGFYASIIIGGGSLTSN